MIEIGAFYRQIAKGVSELGITIDEALERARESGIKWVDVNAALFNDYAPQELAKDLARHGIGVISVHGILNFDYTKKDRVDAAIEMGKGYMDKAKAANSKYFMIVPQRPSGFVEESYDELVDGMRATVAALTVYGKEIGIQPTVENFSKRSVPYASFDTIEWLMKNNPDLRFTLDTGNFTLAGFNELVGSRIFYDKTVYSHIKDMKIVDYKTNAERDGIYYERVVIGDGDVKNEMIIKDFAEKGFDGVFTVEYAGEHQFEVTLLSAKRVAAMIKRAEEENEEGK